MARKFLIAAAAIFIVSLCHENVFADPVHVTIHQKKPKKPKPPPKPKKPKKGAAAEATSDVATTPTLIPPVMSPMGPSAGSDGTVSAPTNNVTTVQGSAATNFTTTGVQAIIPTTTTTTATSNAPSDTFITGSGSLVSNPQAVASALFAANPTQTPVMGGVSTATQPVSNGISYFIGGANPGIVTVPNPIVSTSNVPIDYGQATSPGLVPNNLAPNIPHSPSQQTTISNTGIVGGGTSVGVTNNNGVIGVPSPTFGVNQTVNTGAGIVTFPTVNSTPTSTQLTTVTNTGTTTTTASRQNPATIVLPQSTLTTNNPTSANGNVVGVPAGTTVIANTTGVTGATNNVLGISGSTSSNTVGAFPVNVGAPLSTGLVTSSPNGNLGGVFSDGIGPQNLSGGIAPNLGTIGESPNVGGFTTGIGSSNLSGGAAGTVGGPSSGSNF